MHIFDIDYYYSIYIYEHVTTHIYDLYIMNALLDLLNINTNDTEYRRSTDKDHINN